MKLLSRLLCPIADTRIYAASGGRGFLQSCLLITS